MLVLTPRHMKAIVDAAEAAWPEEACGLLVGRRLPGLQWVVSRVEPAANVATDRRRRFEVDPGLRIGLERELRGRDEAVIGSYHSHPDGPARPSAADQAMTYEPLLLWLIVSVWQGQAVESAAYQPAAQGFRGVRLAIVDNSDKRGGQG